jgi:hypothetical protein
MDGNMLKNGYTVEPTVANLIHSRNLAADKNRGDL